MAAFTSYRSVEDQDNFCAMLGCYLARAPGDFHCCPGHLNLAAQMSNLPFRFYGGFSDNSERDACCTSLIELQSSQIPTGVPDLDEVNDLFNRLPWNSGETFKLRNHPDRCAFLFFKPKPPSYGFIYRFQDEEIKWKGNGKAKSIKHKGSILLIEGVSLRFSGTASRMLKDNHHGNWFLTHFLYKGQSLYCMTYERKSGERGNDDDEEIVKVADDKGKAQKNEVAECQPGMSNPKGPRTQITRPRNMTWGFGRKFNSNPPNLLADDGISFVSWSRKFQKILASNSYNGTTGVIAMECKSSGADGGEIFVLGFLKSSEPSHLRILKGIGSATQGGDPWNRKVQQVSSSTSYDETTGVIEMECKSSDDGEFCVWGFLKSSEPSHLRLLKGIGSATQGGDPWNIKVQQVSSSTSYDETTSVFAIPSSSSYCIGLEDTAVHAAAEIHEVPEEKEESSSPAVALDDAIQHALIVA